MNLILHAINYVFQYQTHIQEFTDLCQLNLDPNNRLIQLGVILLWDRMVGVYLR